MSEFDSPADMPFQLKIEGEKITVTWQPGVPTQSTPGVPNSAQGTITWNIPSPARGCTSVADGTSAYAGVIIVVSTSPLTAANQPVDGTVYRCPEPTVDPDIHTGDKLSNALVVGAFYESEKKANGESLTTTLVVNDVDSQTPYYVGVHAVDAQFRYHTQGAYAYSREYGSEDEEDTCGRQVIELGSGVELTDRTPDILCSVGSPQNGSPLLGSPTPGGSPTPTYVFDLLATDTYPSAVTKDQIIHIEIDGNTACTYEDLISQIRENIANHTISLSSAPVAIDALTYCVEDGVVQQFDGDQFQIVSGAYYETTDPADVNIGDYWYNPTTGELKRDRIPNPLPPPAANGWNDVHVTIHNEDPTQLSGCDDYWFDGMCGWLWETTTWCKKTTYISTTDPSQAPDFDCTLFWYDETNEQLLKWNPTTCVWESCAAIVWDVAPNNLAVGTFWLNDGGSPIELRQWNGAAFNAPLPVTIGEEPVTPFAGQYWYNPETEELMERNGANTDWIDHPVLVWPEDPTNPESCDKWWKPAPPTDELYLWDSINNEWDLVADFVVSPVDPHSPPLIEIGSLWYNSDTQALFVWEGEWVAVNFIDDPADPTMPSPGDAWFNPETNEWFVWNIPVANQWNAIDPIDSTIDPKTIANGAVWYDTANDVLYERIAGAWVSQTFLTDCMGNPCGVLRYNSTTEELEEWNGSEWVVSDNLPVTVNLNVDGHLEFVATSCGSSSVVMVIVPDGVPSGVAVMFGNRCSTVSFSELQTHSFAYYGPDSCNIGIEQLIDCAADNGTTQNNFLFTPSVISIAKILPQIHGFDGVSGTPSYLEPGVGTDSTSDERKALSNWIRDQLGYPVVEVELTQEQLDNAVRRALDVFRQRSSLAYKRGFFFVDTIAGIQHYKLTARENGYNKIVNVMGVYRFTSAFLSTAHGAGVYGQVVLQHLYNMGTYDLTSYHLVSQYIEQLEHLFATRMTFHWDEPTRVLTLYNAFVRDERLLVETTVERTEQEIMVDRWSKNWIERWALAEAQLVLARIRGKYASLPGAGGGVSLDATDLVARAEGEIERLISDMDEYVAQDIEDYGMGTTFLIG